MYTTQSKSFLIKDLLGDVLKTAGRQVIRVSAGE